MELYLKLKTMISLTMGITNGIALAIIGLELPAAWGLMTFLANFIPNVGGPVMSILPCVIALLDIRKSFYQVSAAFLAQFFLHFNIANFVEPVIFGTTKDIHSVVVLLGLSFFGYIWGFTGMFLSVPLLFAMHAWLSVTALNPSASPEARDDARFLMGMLEGHWLGDDDEHQHYDSATAEAEMAALGDAVVLSRELAPAAGLAAAPDVGVQEVVEVVLPGGVEIEGLQSSRPSFGGIGDPPQCSLTEFPVTSWKITGALQVMFSVRHPETKEVQLRGLLLRWLLLLGIGLCIFEGGSPLVDPPIERRRRARHHRCRRSSALGPGSGADDHTCHRWRAHRQHHHGDAGPRNNFCRKARGRRQGCQGAHFTSPRATRADLCKEWSRRRRLR